LISKAWLSIMFSKIMRHILRILRGNVRTRTNIQLFLEAFVFFLKSTIAAVLGRARFPNILRVLFLIETSCCCCWETLIILLNLSLRCHRSWVILLQRWHNNLSKVEPLMFVKCSLGMWICRLFFVEFRSWTFSSAAHLY
jgi:hypothetical protein